MPNVSNQITDEEVFKLLESEKRGKFAPGTHWAYSNSGYVVLGLIVARVSGRPFPKFLHERIFTPLKMDRSVAYVNGTNEVMGRAYGHSIDNGKILDSQGRVVKNYSDTGLPAKLEFDLPAGTTHFVLDVEGKQIRQELH